MLMYLTVLILLVSVCAEYTDETLGNSVDSQNYNTFPFPPGFPNFDFLVSHLNNLQKLNQELAANIQQNVYRYGQGSNGYSGSYSGTGGNGFGTGFSGSYGPGQIGGGSSASASIGPGGIQQTAAVYPENPNMPNINTRFGGSSPGRGGSYGVFTSSVSESRNVDGKPVNYHRASTIVNDNGKVSTYTVKNP